MSNFFLYIFYSAVIRRPTSFFYGRLVRLGQIHTEPRHGIATPLLLLLPHPPRHQSQKLTRRRAHKCKDTRTPTHLHAPTSKHADTLTRTHTRLRTHTYAHVRTHTHTDAHTRTHTRTRVRVRVFARARPWTNTPPATRKRFPCGDCGAAHCSCPRESLSHRDVSRRTFRTDSVACGLGEESFSPAPATVAVALP